MHSTSQGGSTHERYHFDDILVDLAAHTLSRGGEPQTIEPKAFAVLQLLLERAGELVPRDELLDTVWGHRHVTPGVLTRVIAQLRQALADDSHHPKYIQTQHALGYRFIGRLETTIAPATQAESRADVALPVHLPAPDSADAPAGAATGASLIVSDADTRSDAWSPAYAAAAAPAAAYAGTTADRHRRWVRFAALGAALAVVAAALLWTWRKSTWPPPADASIAVLPFTSLSRDRDDGYFAEGLAIEMSDALAGVPELKVAACRSDSACGTRGADAKALGRNLGVATILDATVRREGQQLRISARLTDTRTGYTLWSQNYDRQVTDVFALQTEIADQVVESLLGVLPGRREALARRLTPTRNAAAFDVYLQGLQTLRTSTADADAGNAIGLFNRALAGDRGFALAQVGVCRSELWRFESLRNADAFERARAACQQAERMAPGSGDVAVALGDLYQASGKLDQAVEFYRRAERDPARRPSAYVGMALVRASQGSQDLALDYFRRALALRPGDAFIHAQIGYQQYLRGDLPSAIASYRKATELRPDDADLWSTLGGLYLTAGSKREAEQALQQSIRIKPTSAVLSNYGAIKYQEGDYAAASGLYRRAIAVDPDSFLIWGYLGDALLADPNTAAQARAPFQRAAEMAERYVVIRRDDAKALAALGWYRANLGDVAQARQRLIESEALGTEPGEVALFNAQTLAVIGSGEEARQRIAAARAAGIVEVRISTNAVLKSVSTSRQADGTVVR